MKFRTAASIAVLGIASALGLPAQGETGAQVHVGPPAMRVAGLLGQPQQKETPPPAPSQGGQPDQKAPTQAQREGGQNEEKNVALRLDRFKVTPEADGRARITISTTKEELQQSPEFKTKQDRG